MTDTSTTSIYTAWFDLLPQMFRAMVPAGADSGTDTAAGAEPGPPDPASLPFPANQAAVALQGLDGILTPLYQAWLPVLAQGHLAAGAIQQLADAGTEMFRHALQGGGARAADGLQLQPVWAGFAQAFEPWSMLVNSLVPGRHAGTDVLRTGFERVFGGLSDAFGLGPLREIERAWGEALQAGMLKQRAQVEYLAVVAEAWSEGTRHLLEALAAMGARGQRVESLLALIRMWAKAVDGPLHDAMQKERGLAATAGLLRASTVQREHLQKAVALTSEALHIPTRAEVDEAYREIQQIKRELRRLRKSLSASASASAPASASTTSAAAEEQDA